MSVFRLLTPTVSYVEVHLFEHDELGNRRFPPATQLRGLCSEVAVGDGRGCDEGFAL